MSGLTKQEEETLRACVVNSFSVIVRNRENSEKMAANISNIIEDYENRGSDPSACIRRIKSAIKEKQAFENIPMDVAEQYWTRMDLMVRESFKSARDRSTCSKKIRKVSKQSKGSNKPAQPKKNRPPQREILAGSGSQVNQTVECSGAYNLRDRSSNQICYNESRNSSTDSTPPPVSKRHRLTSGSLASATGICKVYPSNTSIPLQRPTTSTSGCTDEAIEQYVATVNVDKNELRPNDTAYANSITKSVKYEISPLQATPDVEFCEEVQTNATVPPVAVCSMPGKGNYQGAYVDAPKLPRMNELRNACFGSETTGVINAQQWQNQYSNPSLMPVQQDGAAQNPKSIYAPGYILPQLQQDFARQDQSGFSCDSEGVQPIIKMLSDSLDDTSTNIQVSTKEGHNNDGHDRNDGQFPVYQGHPRGPRQHQQWTGFLNHDAKVPTQGDKRQMDVAEPYYTSQSTATHVSEWDYNNGNQFQFNGPTNNPRLRRVEMYTQENAPVYLHGNPLQIEKSGDPRWVNNFNGNQE